MADEVSQIAVIPERRIPEALNAEGLRSELNAAESLLEWLNRRSRYLILGTGINLGAVSNDQTCNGRVSFLASVGINVSV